MDSTRTQGPLAAGPAANDAKSSSAYAARARCSSSSSERVALAVVSLCWDGIDGVELKLSLVSLDDELPSLVVVDDDV